MTFLVLYVAVNNIIFLCPGLVDSVQYVMDLLRTCSYNSTFDEDSPKDMELTLSPKSHVSFCLSCSTVSMNDIMMLVLTGF